MKNNKRQKSKLNKLLKLYRVQNKQTTIYNKEQIQEYIEAQKNKF